MSQTNRVILLIEDDPDDQFLTQNALRKSNINNEMIVAANGEAAMAILSGCSEKDARMSCPSLILLDLNLQGQSGLEVLRAIRANPRTCGVPVVVLTGLEEQAVVEECYRSGANSFVLKPENGSDFAETMIQIVMYWCWLNCAPLEP